MAKKVIGVVTSDVQDKTIVVTMTSRLTHPLYGKQYSRSRKFTAHDEENVAKKGDRVEIVECRPISKRKTWKLDHVIEAGHVEVELKDEAEEVLATKAEKVEDTVEEKV